MWILLRPHQIDFLFSITWKKLNVGCAESFFSQKIVIVLNLFPPNKSTVTAADGVYDLLHILTIVVSQTCL